MDAITREHAFEPRHPSFFCTEAVDILRRHRVALAFQVLRNGAAKARVISITRKPYRIPRTSMMPSTSLPEPVCS